VISYSIDVFADPEDREPVRTIQVPALSLQEALRKVSATMADHERVARPSSKTPDEARRHGVAPRED
jgi:hypothetical protein